MCFDYNKDHCIAADIVRTAVDITIPKVCTTEGKKFQKEDLKRVYLKGINAYFDENGKEHQKVTEEQFERIFIEIEGVFTNHGNDGYSFLKLQSDYSL